MPKPTRKPLGKALKWTDKQLEELSTITPQDIEAAKVLVKAASPELAQIIEAKPVDAENKPII